jgi:hypothetical protein
MEVEIKTEIEVIEFLEQARDEGQGAFSVQDPYGFHVNEDGGSVFWDVDVDLVEAFEDMDLADQAIFLGRVLRSLDPMVLNKLKSELLPGQSVDIKL